MTTILSCYEVYIYIFDEIVVKYVFIIDDFGYVCSFIDVDAEMSMSSEKLQRLGWRYRPLDETLTDSLKSYRGAGILDH